MACFAEFRGEDEVALKYDSIFLTVVEHIVTVLDIIRTLMRCW